MITILGIDPGYGTIGYGVVRFDNMKFTPVQYGAAKTAPGTPMHLRLCEIYDDICTLVDTFHPDEVAIEELFFSKNVTTGIQVAQARGVILLALAQKGLHPVSYTRKAFSISPSCRVRTMPRMRLRWPSATGIPGRPCAMKAYYEV